MINRINRTVLAFIIIFSLSCTAEDDGSTSLGNTSTFEVTTFSPIVGLEGTELTLNGNNFGSGEKNIVVQVGDKTATTKSINNDKIVISAPYNKRGTQSEITIKIDGESESYQETFKYAGPIIDDFYPKTSVLFSDVVIKGSYFNRDTSNLRVYLGNSRQQIISASYDSIIFQTTSREILPSTAELSVQIDEEISIAQEEFRYGTDVTINQDDVNNNYHAGIGICPGSAINFELNDNRQAGNLQGSTTTSEDPEFYFNQLKGVTQFDFPTANGGRNWYIDVPTSMNIGNANVETKVAGENIYVGDALEVEIVKGTFNLKSRTVHKSSSIEIELSHIFRYPENLVIKFHNNLDNSIITKTDSGHSYSEDFTKTNIFVPALNEAGSYTVLVFTADEVYQFEALDGDQLETTD